MPVHAVLPRVGKKDRKGLMQEELDVAIEREQVELDAFAADTDRADQFLELVKRYTDLSVLTTPMILEFVDKIVVYAPDKSSGERMQEVDIYLKFIGKFDVLIPGAYARGIGRAGKAAKTAGETTGIRKACLRKEKAKDNAGSVL